MFYLTTHIRSLGKRTFYWTIPRIAKKDKIKKNQYDLPSNSVLFTTLLRLPIHSSFSLGSNVTHIMARSGHIREEYGP